MIFFGGIKWPFIFLRINVVQSIWYILGSDSRSSNRQQQQTVLAITIIAKSIKWWLNVAIPIKIVWSWNGMDLCWWIEWRSIHSSYSQSSFKQQFLISGIDLSLLSMANHSIATYGTFGIWGALLAGGQMTFPKSHLTDGSIQYITPANFSNIHFI